MADRYTTALSEGDIPASELIDPEDPRVRTIREILASATPTGKPAAVPLHEHCAFDDLEKRICFIQRGVEAIKGLGAMMLPEHGDFQMNMAHSADAAAVFNFFGEALSGPAYAAYDDLNRIRWAAEGKQP